MRKFPLIWLAVAVCLSGCTALEGNYGQSPESFVSEGEDLCLPLALSVGTVKPQTKMTPAITQADATEASFRGIKEIYAIPFRAARPVNGSDERIGPNLLLPQLGIPSTFGDNAQDGAFEGLVRSNNSHLYKNVYMRRGTASMLVYGQAIDANVSVDPDSVAFKRRNGVLRAHNQYSAQTPSQITFTLEPFITSANKASLQSTVDGLLTYLNSIAGATVSQTGYNANSANQSTWTYRWSTPTDYSNYADLKNAFTYFTADEVGFSAGSPGINQMLTTLYNRLYEMANNTTVGGDSYRLTYYTRANTNSNTYRVRYYYVYQLARQIRTLINNSTYVTVTNANTNNATVALKDTYANFPDSYGVPAGCVALQWNGTQFVQQTPATGSALAPIDSYCYPPSLWYTTNSTIKTSDDSSVTEEYKSANVSWADIFNQYTFSSAVVQGSESAAIKDPLQYGVAMLEVNLNKAESLGGTQLSRRTRRLTLRPFWRASAVMSMTTRSTTAAIQRHILQVHRQALPSSPSTPLWSPRKTPRMYTWPWSSRTTAGQIFTAQTPIKLQQAHASIFLLSWSIPRHPLRPERPLTQYLSVTIQQKSLSA